MMNIRRKKSLGRWLTILILSVASILAVAVNFDYSKKTNAGSCSVTLTGSPFSDPDAEDTHLASQWVVTEGGSGVYDSGRDTGNLTTITISGSYFTDSHTYSWKVRYQDQHYRWGNYSDEASFVYSCGSGPTSTPAPTSTGTSTSTPTPTATATPPPPSEPCPWGGWQVNDSGVWVCTDLTIMAVQVVKPNGGESFRGCEQMEISYVANPGFIGWNSILDSSPASTVTVTKNKNWRHDIYLSTDGNKYQRIVKDFDYSGTWSWSDSNLFFGPLFSLNYYIPPEISATDQAKILVHVYDYTFPIGLGGYDWGNEVVPFTTENQVNQAFDTSDDSFQISWGCPGPTPVPTLTPDTGSRTKIDVISPQTGDGWKIGSSYQVLWTTRKSDETAPDVNKVNILLSLDGGKSFNEPLAVAIDNTGVNEVTALAKYKTNHAVIKIEPPQYQAFVQNGLSGEFRINETGIGGECGFFCDWIHDPIKPITAILLLGSLVASLLSGLILLIASSPILVRILEGAMPFISTVGMFLSHPFSFFYLWRRKGNWGIVYDSVTKEPLARVALRLFSEPDEKFREVQYSNAQGRFGFLVPAGKYTVVATKTGFVFPTHLVHSTSDNGFENVYRGEELAISSIRLEDKTPIKISIPLDQSRISATDLTLASLTRFIQNFFGYIRVPFMALGFLTTIYAILTIGVWYYWAILGIYVLLWLIEIRRMILPRTYGLVQDETGRGVALALVRVVDQNGRLKATLITGSDGKFNASLAVGNYRFIVSRAGYQSTRSDLTEISKIRGLGRINLKISRVSKVVRP